MTQVYILMYSASEWIFLYKINVLIIIIKYLTTGIEIHQIIYLSGGQLEPKVTLSIQQFTCPMN